MIDDSTTITIDATATPPTVTIPNLSPPPSGNLIFNISPPEAAKQKTLIQNLIRAAGLSAGFVKSANTLEFRKNEVARNGGATTADRHTPTGNAYTTAFNALKAAIGAPGGSGGTTPPILRFTAANSPSHGSGTTTTRADLGTITMRSLPVNRLINHTDGILHNRHNNVRWEEKIYVRDSNGEFIAVNNTDTLEQLLAANNEIFIRAKGANQSEDKWYKAVLGTLAVTWEETENPRPLAFSAPDAPTDSLDNIMGMLGNSFYDAIYDANGNQIEDTNQEIGALVNSENGVYIRRHNDDEDDLNQDTEQWSRAEFNTEGTEIVWRECDNPREVMRYNAIAGSHTISQIREAFRQASDQAFATSTFTFCRVESKDSYSDIETVTNSDNESTVLDASTLDDVLNDPDNSNGLYVKRQPSDGGDPVWYQVYQRDDGKYDFRICD